MLGRISILKVHAVMLCGLSLIACADSVRDVTSVEPTAPGRSSVTGTILGNNGSPLANAEVHLCREVQTFVGCFGRMGITKTDDAGRFWFRNVPPGSYAPAVLVGENKLESYTLEKGRTAVPKALTYAVEADQSIQLPPLRLTAPLDGPMTDPRTSVSLLSPKLSETTAERRPDFRWEAFPGANFYVVYLWRLPESKDDNGEHFWGERSRGFGETAATNFTAEVDLEPGVYQWHVEAYNRVGDFTDENERLATSNKDHGYFTVARN